MRVTVASIGRLKDGGERVLVDRYLERLAGARTIGIGPISEKEVPEARHATALERQAFEAQRLLKMADGADLIIALDETGRQFTSMAFANWLGGVRDSGTRHLAFLLGGPDGHGSEALKAARGTFSLGTLTLPHGIARAVLMEQLYRATTILAGHPYHRS